MRLARYWCLEAGWQYMGSLHQLLRFSIIKSKNYIFCEFPVLVWCDVWCPLYAAPWHGSQWVRLYLRAKEQGPVDGMSGSTLCDDGAELVRTICGRSAHGPRDGPQFFPTERFDHELLTQTGLGSIPKLATCFLLPWVELLSFLSVKWESL